MLGRLLALILAFSLSTVHAEPPAQHMITATEILTSYVKATGGLERHQNLSTVEIEGMLNLVPLMRDTGDDFHYWQKVPDDDLFELDIRSHGSSWIGHQHGRPVSDHSVEGAGMINGVSTMAMERSLRVLTEWNWTVRYTKIELLGGAMVDGKRTYAIGFTPLEGDRQIRYYDPNTFLLVRMDQAQRFRPAKGEEGAYMVETYFSDYKETDGLQVPRTIGFRCSLCGIQLNIRRVATNAPIEDSKFAIKK